MVKCSNSCSSGPKNNVAINYPIRKPISVFFGETFSVSVDIIDKSFFVGDEVKISLHDLDTGDCLDDTGYFLLDAGAQTTITFNNIKGPSVGSLHLRISVNVVDVLTWQETCQDHAEITIVGKDPSATRYDCVVDKCQAVKDGQFASPDCDKTCGGGEGTTDKAVCDSEKDMNIMGICVPKPIVLGAFALGAIYIFKS